MGLFARLVAVAEMTGMVDVERICGLRSDTRS